MAAGTLGRPGMSIMSPASATIKPAPLLNTSSRMVTSKPSGRPSNLGLSESEYCVLAMMTALFQAVLIHSSKGDGQTYRASFFGASQVQPLEAL